MLEINLSAKQLTNSLLNLSKSEPVFLLDSSNIRYLGSHLLIAGIKPIESSELSYNDPHKTLSVLDKKLANKSTANIFTISYDFGLKLEKIPLNNENQTQFFEPDIFISDFDTLIIHNYKTSKTYLKGNERNFDRIQALLNNIDADSHENLHNFPPNFASSNFSKETYIQAVEEIQELIKQGDTYQTNLTQQFRVPLKNDISPQIIFSKLIKNHPSAFSAFIKRDKDWVLSISPERLVKIFDGEITASPIKGTRKRGKNSHEDEILKKELLMSKKDLAENTMIVDLLRNDIGRICEFGTVKVEKLCELETHPTLFHLVSTISGKLKTTTTPSEIIKAVFPCGSITGCPKIETMKIINSVEESNRGLSMGAIGYSDFENNIEMSVAIRTMVIRSNEAVFNVGGGIVIDSSPLSEYEESLLKAKALFKALNCKL